MVRFTGRKGAQQWVRKWHLHTLSFLWQRWRSHFYINVLPNPQYGGDTSMTFSCSGHMGRIVCRSFWEGSIHFMIPLSLHIKYLEKKCNSLMYEFYIKTVNLLQIFIPNQQILTSFYIPLHAIHITAKKPYRMIKRYVSTEFVRKMTILKIGVKIYMIG